MMLLNLSTLGPQSGEKFLGGTHESPYRTFQDIPRHVAKFRENRPKDVEKPVGGKRKKTRVKYNSLPLSLKLYAGQCSSSSSSKIILAGATGEGVRDVAAECKRSRDWSSET